MTVESEVHDDSFRRIMESLHLDVSEFTPLVTNLSDLDYKELEATKKNIERQLMILFDILNNKYNSNMEMNLLTEDGFPRNDIDVASIRLIRVKIIRLRNDAKRIYSFLEEKLIEQFSKNGGEQAQQNSSENILDIQETFVIPFSLVRDVDEMGPAYRAGIRKNDKLIAVDKIHAGNHDNMRLLQSTVLSNLEKPLKIVLLRESTRVNLELTPTRNWSGPGVLGCHLVAL